VIAVGSKAAPIISKLFERQPAREKRRLLNVVLSNCS
jgi:hypothetical protein